MLKKLKKSGKIIFQIALPEGVAMKKTIILFFIFIMIISSNHAMIQRISNYFNRPSKANIVQKILKDRELMMEKAQASESCVTEAVYQYGSTEYTIRVIKKRQQEDIETRIICSNQEILDEVNKLLPH